jgi:glycosyltransferase involved in cell wall biosynthesis
MKTSTKFASRRCRAVVLWIDWYPYHVARFKGLQSAFGLNGEVVGIEMVGGIGVHAGLRFRESWPENLPVITLRPRQSWQEAGKLRLALSIWNQLSKLNPEVVLVPGYYTLPAIAAALWARLHGRASVLMSESTEQDHQRFGLKEVAKSALIRALFNWAVVGGKAHRRYLRKLHFPADRIAGSYDVVDNREIAARTQAVRRDSLPEDYNLPSDYFLYVGRLSPEKNVKGLIDEWNSYRERGGTWSLVLAGDGPEAQALRILASRSRFSADIHFTGHKSFRELTPYYAFARCFVLPSTREPWGLVVNEAMSASLPVLVSTACGSAEDLVDNGRNGLLFNPRRRGCLAASLSAMEKTAPLDLQSMGRESLGRIAAYSPEGFGHEIARIADRGAHRRTSYSAASSQPEPSL